MKTTLTISSPKDWVRLILWIFLIVFAGKFILTDALPYLGLNPEILGRFWQVKWFLVGHVLGGIIALITGPVQFWPQIRQKYLRFHRILGRFYLGAILIGSISSVGLAFTSAMAVHWTWAAGLLALAVGWFFSAAMAFRSILLKRREIHKEWMIRSYIITFAFVSFRWLVYLPPVVGLGNFVERAPTAGWIAWVIPLFFAEIIMDWNKK